MRIENIDYDLNDNKLILDIDPKYYYFVLKKLEKDTNSLYICEKFEGIRFTIEMTKPSPAFFFSVADFMEHEHDDFVIIFHEKLNLIGAYFTNIR